jgi:hypothetical protein
MSLDVGGFFGLGACAGGACTACCSTAAAGVGQGAGARTISTASHTAIGPITLHLFSNCATSASGHERTEQAKFSERGSSSCLHEVPL